ncbi:MAG: transglutaminase family protein [Mangrovicoccus sp.]|nr:transglutaminase family protein [Mangrovicoccus sp.]
MIYDIKLRVYYEYEHPIDLGRQVVRVVPQKLARDQRLITSRLEISPSPVERRDALDFFGNTLTELGFDCFSTELELNLRARVERRGGAGGLDLSPPRPALLQELEHETRLDALSPLHFLGNSPRVRLSSLFQRFGEDHTAHCATVLECVEALGQALHQEMEFLPGATEVDTAPEVAFEERRGVCQDFSHIMIASLRSMGIPAGYVSGFLRTLPPPGQPRLEGADAMHAWVRAWCGADLGWVDYDPTNAMRAGRDHVEVAVGRDYADVSPLRGVTRSSGQGSTGHSVDMIELTES